MLRRFLLGTGILAAVTAAACTGNEAVSAADVSQSAQGQGCATCGYLYNGTGVHVASALPYSKFGVTDPINPWAPIGFRNSGSSVTVTGWRGLFQVEAQVVDAQYDGATYQLVSVQTGPTAPTRLVATLQAADGTQRTVTGDNLVARPLTLDLLVPAISGLVQLPVQLRIGAESAVTSQFNDVLGYDVQLSVPFLGFFGSHCVGSSGAAERAVFYQGSHWDPSNAARTDGSSLVTMTCESGGVARCMQWGYSPFGNAKLPAKVAQQYHQACLQLKRAAYCGDDKTNDKNGMPIEIQDPFGIHQIDPYFFNESHVEAEWNETGASCVIGNPLHRRDVLQRLLPFSRIPCVNPLTLLPFCGAADFQNYNPNNPPARLISKYLDPIDLAVGAVINAVNVLQ